MELYFPSYKKLWIVSNQEWSVQLNLRTHDDSEPLESTKLHREDGMLLIQRGNDNRMLIKFE